MRCAQAHSGQLSAFERHEIVAACEEYEGIVMQCAARKLKQSALSVQLLNRRARGDRYGPDDAANQHVRAKPSRRDDAKNMEAQ
jgi:hypothetical protein